jgi:glyoxylase-like metal-dependent hydrolase (beta-lactamase superfamily II)
VEDGGESAVITGDMIHHPLQLARPEFASTYCADPAQSCVSRRSLFGRLAGGPTLLIGSHFCEPTAGRVVAAGGAFRLECVEVAVPAE